jgi:hypothetical protein
MKDFENALKQLRDKLEGKAKGDVGTSKKELSELLEKLKKGGLSPTDAIKQATDIIDGLSGGIGKYLEETIVVELRSEAKDHLQTKAKEVLGKEASKILGGAVGGPVGAILGGLAKELIDDLFQSKSERIHWVDLKTLENEKNKKFLGRVIAGSAVLKEFLQQNSRQPERLEEFALRTKAERHILVRQLVATPDIQASAKLKILDYLRQWNVITPGQRRQIQDLIQELLKLDTPAKKTINSPEDAADFFELLILGKTVPTPTGPSQKAASTEVMKTFGASFVKGIQEDRKEVWNLWFNVKPSKRRDNARLGIKLEKLGTLLVSSNQKKFEKYLLNHKAI